MPNITPTVGRKVWYFTHGAQAEPIDATVIKVHDDEGDGSTPVGKTPQSRVNLLAIHPDTGAATFQPGVPVGDESTEGEHYRWMPYQQGQAAKAASESGQAPEPIQVTAEGVAAPTPPATRKKKGG